MAFEVPTDLINQSQIGFREDAGLSSFDPEDPTLPSLPTVEALISALDPSSPHLRCKHCNGKLLRGTHSLICIYCGQCQAKDLPPDPILFHSTTGYRWLLQSLNLNASEKVAPQVEEDRWNKGRSPAEDGIALAELLDLQILWRNEPKKHEQTGVVNKTFDDSSSSLNLGQVELDNATGSQRDVAHDASEEQPVTSENDQSNALVDQENLSTCENVQPPETAATSSDVSGDASSGHDAETQSVDSRTQDDDCKSDNQSVGSEADRSAHMEGLNNGKLNNSLDPLPSTGDDLVQDDPDSQRLTVILPAKGAV